MFEFLKRNRAETALENKSNNSYRSAKEKVLKWLSEERFEVTEVQDEKSNFRYLATRVGMPKFSVLQPRGKMDSILVESGVSFRGLGNDSATRIVQDQSTLWNLRLHLESKGFFFNIQTPKSDSSDSDGGVVFARPLYFDGISKDRVLETVLDVVHTVRFIILTMQRHMLSDSEKSGIPVYLR
jgi:hypothetical protein